MQVSCLAVLLQFVFVKFVSAQSSIIPAVRSIQSQVNSIPTLTSKRQLLNSLLSTYDEDQIPQRIEIITSAIQQMPPKRNKKIYLAEMFKQKAIQSLTEAANACKGAGILPAEFGLPRSNALPVASVPEYGLPFANLPEYGSPFASVPEYRLPFASVPEYRLPFASLPEYGLPLSNALPVASVPVREGNLPVDYLQYLNKNLRENLVPSRAVRIYY